MNEQEKQWLTGFFEGDGSIFQTTDGAAVTFGQKERDILDYTATLVPNGRVHADNHDFHRLNYRRATSVATLISIFIKYVVSAHTQGRLNDLLTFEVLRHEPTIDWLAGFWDAEGSSTTTPGIQIVQKEKETLNAIQGVFGGNVCPNGPYWTWYVNGNEARELHLKILNRSHCLTKALKMQEHFDGTTYYELHHREHKAYDDAHRTERSEYNKKQWQKQKLMREYIKEHPEVVASLETKL